MSDVIKSIEYRPEIPLDNTEVRSIKIVFQNKMKIETTTGDSYKAEHLYIKWGERSELWNASQSNAIGVDPWVASTGNGTRVLLSGVKAVNFRKGSIPIEVLHNIIVAAHRSVDESDTETSSVDIESQQSVDNEGTDSEVDSSLVRSLLSQTRKLFS